MALTGLQIFKLLPQTNCKKCGYPTCLAFAMKLAAGKESLEKCPDASEEARAALGAASAPPIRPVVLGDGPRAASLGEETVFFRHEKTFVRPPPLLRLLDAAAQEDAGALARRLDAWAAESIPRAGETFRVGGVAVEESPGRAASSVAAAAAACERGLPVALLARTPAFAKEALARLAGRRPLLVPPEGEDPAPFIALAAAAKVPVVVFGRTVEELATRAAEAVRAGAGELLLGPTATSPRELLETLVRVRRGALDRAHPGLAYPVYLRCPPGDLERAVLGIAKFASLLVLDDAGGEVWLPLYTLRQNLYTDPQKPLRVDPGVYPIGEPTPRSPLLVTTNFSLTYFIVSTELEGSGVPCHLAVVDAEGMSVLTAWSAGKFGGERVGKFLKESGATARVEHRNVIIPGLVAVISGELEDTLGEGYRVIPGPQEASDLGAFLRALEV
jgi:acetyl-CoA decarbonylase/synthase, CODH/ACS complex subunit gamma